MGIKDEIFEGFFKKLERDGKFPDKIIEELKKLWREGNIASQENIFEVIKKGCEDASKD